MVRLMLSALDCNNTAPQRMQRAVPLAGIGGIVWIRSHSWQAI
jgi:hypothetical protein